MFWDKKITCEQCNKKAKEKTAVYSRGSYFCNDACRDAWSAANPAPVARGERPKLEQELALCIDGALDEYSKAFNVKRNRVRVSVSIGLDGSHHGVGHMMSNINAQHEAEQRQTALMTFQSNLLRCPALLRALGYDAVAAQIESVDFVKALETGTISGRVRSINHDLEQIRGALSS